MLKDTNTVVQLDTSSLEGQIPSAMASARRDVAYPVAFDTSKNTAHSGGGYRAAINPASVMFSFSDRSKLMNVP